MSFLLRLTFNCMQQYRQKHNQCLNTLTLINVTFNTLFFSSSHIYQPSIHLKSCTSTQTQCVNSNWSLHSAAGGPDTCTCLLFSFFFYLWGCQEVEVQHIWASLSSESHVGTFFWWLRHTYCLEDTVSKKAAHTVCFGGRSETQPGVDYHLCPSPSFRWLSWDVEDCY